MTKQRKFEVRQGLSGYCFVGQGHGTGSTNPGLVTVVRHTLEHHEKGKGHWCIFFRVSPNTAVSSSECMTSNDSMISKNVMERMGTERAVVQFQALPTNFSVGPEETQKENHHCLP